MARQQFMDMHWIERFNGSTGPTMSLLCEGSKRHLACLFGTLTFDDESDGETIIAHLRSVADLIEENHAL